MKGGFETRVCALVVFTVSVGLTLLFWAVLPAQYRHNESTDYDHFYEPVARRLLSGEGMAEADGAPALRYPPGYPVVLAGVFGAVRGLRIPEAVALSAMTLLCMGLSSVFVFFVARSVWRPGAALGVALVWATYPCLLWLTKQPNSELPFCVSFYGGMALLSHALWKRPRAQSYYGLAGLCFGLSMLIRPIAIGFGVMASLMIWIGHRGAKPRPPYRAMLLLLLGTVLAVLPWEGWVYGQTGRWIWLSDNGPASMLDGFVFTGLERASWRAGVIPPDVERLGWALRRETEAMTSLGDIGRQVLAAWHAEPWTMSKLIGLKLARSWYGTDSMRYEPWILGLQLLYLATIVWSGWKAWQRGGTSRQLSLCMYGGGHVVFLGHDRPGGTPRAIYGAGDGIGLRIVADGLVLPSGRGPTSALRPKPGCRTC